MKGVRRTGAGILDTPAGASAETCPPEGGRGGGAWHADTARARLAARTMRSTMRPAAGPPRAERGRRAAAPRFHRRGSAGIEWSVADRRRTRPCFIRSDPHGPPPAPPGRERPGHERPGHERPGHERMKPERQAGCFPAPDGARPPPVRIRSMRMLRGCPPGPKATRGYSGVGFEAVRASDSSPLRRRIRAGFGAGFVSVTESPTTWHRQYGAGDVGPAIWRRRRAMRRTRAV